MYRLLSYAERDTLFLDTVFRIWFSDVILLLIARYGFAVTSVDLYSWCVNNFWAAFVTPFADSFLQAEIKQKQINLESQVSSYFNMQRKKVIGSRGIKSYM